MIILSLYLVLKEYGLMYNYFFAAHQCDVQQSNVYFIEFFLDLHYTNLNINKRCYIYNQKINYTDTATSQDA